MIDENDDSFQISANVHEWAREIGKQLSQLRRTLYNISTTLDDFVIANVRAARRITHARNVVFSRITRYENSISNLVKAIESFNTRLETMHANRIDIEADGPAYFNDVQSNFAEKFKNKFNRLRSNLTILKNIYSSSVANVFPAFVFYDGTSQLSQETLEPAALELTFRQLYVELKAVL